MWRRMDLLCNAVGFSVSPAIPLLLAHTFCNRDRLPVRLAQIPLLFNLVIAVSSPWTGWYFTVSQEGRYMRGPLFAGYMICYGLMLLMLLQQTIVVTREYQNKSCLMPLVLYWYVVLGTSIQLCWPEVHTTWLCVTVSIGMYYAYFCELSEKYDTVTRLFNRRAYERDKMSLGGSTIGVVMLDVDNFKLANDCCGHAYGDFCLGHIGTALRHTFDEVGTCYRIGGDELCVICRDTVPEVIDQRLKTFEKMLAAERAKSPQFPTVSAGVAFYGDYGNLEAVIQAADQQLYRNKTQRKDDLESLL